MGNKVVNIKLTQHCISKGEWRDTHRCPIALAIVLQMSYVSLVYVYPAQVHIFFWGDKMERYSLPPEATEFIFNFDKELPVEPFEFEMRLME